MPNTYDVYLSIIVTDFIENAPIPNAYAPPIGGAGKFEATRRTWVLQGSKGFDDSRSHRMIERLYFSLG